MEVWSVPGKQVDSSLAKRNIWNRERKRGRGSKRITTCTNREAGDGEQQRGRAGKVAGRNGGGTQDSGNGRVAGSKGREVGEWAAAQGSEQRQRTEQPAEEKRGLRQSRRDLWTALCGGKATMDSSNDDRRRDTRMRM
ncbi:hypothetical protein TRVL_02652 [Trypanosoma vivax]|nr:hypothetical protein TRVL_02652 [Trypanosoma vivax]